MKVGYNRGMKVGVARLTIEELHRLPEDSNRYELVDGELYVSAAPRQKHQRISSDLHDWLSPFAKKHNLGRVYHAAFDVFLDPPKQTCVQPDLLFVSQDRRHIIKEDGVYGPPHLVVEIVSESTHRADTSGKRDLYRRAGVREYWIVNPDECYLLVYRFDESAEPRKLVVGDILTTPLLPGLEIPVNSLFAD